MKRILVILAALAMFASCTPDELFVSITGPAEFTNGKATVTLSLTGAPSDFVDVLLACSPTEGVTMKEQVTINPGNTSVAVEVDATGLEATSDLNVEVRIVEAIGASVGSPANVVMVLKPGSYNGGNGDNGDNGNGDNGNGNGNGETNMTLQANWKVDMISEPYTDEDGNWVDVQVTAAGIKYFYVYAYIEGQDPFGSFEELVAAIEEWVKAGLANGDDITDYLWTSVEEDCWVEYPGAGTTKLYVVEFEADGSLTGRYGETTVTMPEYEQQEEEEELDFTGYTFMPNWTVSLDGDPYEYSESYYVDVTVNAPGISYYWLDIFYPGEITFYYGGFDEMAKEWEDSMVSALEEDVISNVLWAAGETGVWLNYYGDGAQTVYVIEFDETGHLTGRFGATEIDMPEVEGMYGAPAIRKVRVARSSAPASRHQLMRKLR